MNAIIVEDERVAAESLIKSIGENEDIVNIKVLCVLQSVEECVAYLSNNPHPEIIFLDIHLADGSCFNIFNYIKVESYIIFVTAYDEYALRAFEQNSIDYLLKPINKSDLSRALHKLKKLYNNEGNEERKLPVYSNLLHNKSENTMYKSAFLVQERDKLIPLHTDEIAYIFLEDKNIKVVTYSDQVFYIGQNLDEIMQQLNPKLFFRANRQYIIARDAVKDMTLWFGGKLLINLKIGTKEKIFVSKARVPEFKLWFSY